MPARTLVAAFVALAAAAPAVADPDFRFNVPVAISGLTNEGSNFGEIEQAGVACSVNFREPNRITTIGRGEVMLDASSGTIVGDLAVDVFVDPEYDAADATNYRCVIMIKPRGVDALAAIDAAAVLNANSAFMAGSGFRAHYGAENSFIHEGSLP